jgi:hypothetical protein
MLGSVQSNCSFDIAKLSKARQAKVAKMADALKRYYHELTNHADDEWESATYDQGQNRPASAY